MGVEATPGGGGASSSFGSHDYAPAGISGYLHWEVDPDAFRLLTPDAPLRNYQFGTRTSKNLFCGTCGISAFRHSRSRPDGVDVNARCLERVETDALGVSHFDGRSWR